MMIRCTILSCLAVLTLGCGNQPETDPAINISAADITAGINTANREVCRANMQTVASAVAVHRAQNGVPPESPGELAGGASCPEHGAYSYSVAGVSWKLECPGTPPHGSITDGTPDW